jgi:hypothetical protein
MKKVLLSIGAALSLIACNQVPQETAGTATQQQIQQPLADTAGLASFRNWKVQNELADISEYQAQQIAPVAAAPRQIAKKKAAAPVRHSNPAPAPKPVEQTQTSTSDNTAKNETGSGAGTGTTGAGDETAQTEKKGGWSKAEKGAVIGGIAGAAGGAVINKKNRVAGAVIGAVIGAGGGYAIGRGMDKKDGRID